MSSRTPALPFQSPVSRLRDALHSLFADVANQFGSSAVVAVDVVDEPKAIVIRIDLLSLAPDDLDVEVDGDMLRLRGSRLVEALETGRGDRNFRSRRWHFLRGVQLPDNLVPSTAEAHYRNGLLSIKVRKKIA